MIPIERTNLPGLLITAAPDDWMGPKEVQRNVGKLEPITDQMFELIPIALARITERTGVRFVGAKTPKQVRNADILFYSVEAFRKNVAENGICWRHRGREFVVLRQRAFVERDIDWCLWLIQHEVLHGMGLDHPLDRSISAVIQPRFGDDLPPLETVLYPTEADVEAVNRARGRR